MVLAQTRSDGGVSYYFPCNCGASVRVTVKVTGEIYTFTATHNGVNESYMAIKTPRATDVLEVMLSVSIGRESADLYGCALTQQAVQAGTP